MDELLSLQEFADRLTAFGVDHFVGQLKAQRRLLHKVRTIAATELVELLGKMVELDVRQDSAVCGSKIAPVFGDKQRRQQPKTTVC